MTDHPGPPRPAPAQIVAGPGTVSTATGTVAAGELGVTLMHEHVFVLDPEIVLNFGQSWWDEDTRVADAAAKLTAAKHAGIDSIVEMTVPGIGRDIRLLQAVAARTQVNIVCATGVYTFSDLPRLFRNEGPGLAVDGPDPLAAAFVADITQGIGGTSVRAGMLKCVWQTPVLPPGALRVQEAIAQAHRMTGTPITVHTDAAERTGRTALDFYDQHGVDLTRVIVGHAGDSTDLDYLLSIVDRGAVVGADRFGLDTYSSSEDRVRMVAELCRRGHANQVILSQDSAAFTESWARPAAQAAMGLLLPNWHYTYIVEQILGELRSAEVTDDDIHTMMVLNPARLLSPVATALR